MPEKKKSQSFVKKWFVSWSAGQLVSWSTGLHFSKQLFYQTIKLFRSLQKTKTYHSKFIKKSQYETFLFLVKIHLSKSKFEVKEEYKLQFLLS